MQIFDFFFREVFMRINSKIVVAVMAVLVCVLSVSVVFAEEFPHRKDFPNVSHIPMAYATFINDVMNLIKENPKKIIVFYCNGVTCLKSYESAQKMTEAGYKNSFAYDAGIPGWSKLYPSQTIVLGKTLKNPEKQLI